LGLQEIYEAEPGKFEFHIIAMLTNSRDIKRRLEQEGWVVERVTGSHHVLKHPRRLETIVLPHPKKDLGRGLVRNIYKQAGWEFD
jgi:predicted RNA binding protein YcfA (HicA-like mRNA interferase family)